MFVMQVIRDELKNILCRSYIKERTDKKNPVLSKLYSGKKHMKNLIEEGWIIILLTIIR